MTHCKESGNSPEHHFISTGKMIEPGRRGLRDVDDNHLFRFARYPMNQKGLVGISRIAKLRGPDTSKEIKS